MHITIDKATVDKTTAQALTELQAGLIGIGDVQSRIQQLISQRLRNRIILDLLPQSIQIT